MAQPSQIFISYAREDREYREQLEKHLALLPEARVAPPWSDNMIPAGDEWRAAVHKALGEAALCVFLVSIDSIASKHCKGELAIARERGIRVVPVRVRPCPDDGPQITDYQMLPRDCPSIEEAPSQDRAWTAVVEELKELLNARPPPPLRKSSVSTGEYLELQKGARDAVNAINALSTKLGWRSVGARVEAIKTTLLQDPYRVVITGKSRAGKSTLMNALVGRTLCPVDRRLTTAAPTIIGPGDPEMLTINFENDKSKSIEGPLTDAHLKPFVTQEHNPENKKQVSELRIELPDDNCLALGVEYADIPGLDDRHESISARAQSVVDRSHAWVVVIDVSPALDGGFTVDRSTVELARKAGERPLFIVANKEDRLDEAMKAEAAAEIEKTLGKRPFFISAKHAQTTHAAAFRAFYDALWEALWKTEANGLRRLRRVFEELRLAGYEAATLMRARDHDDEPERRSLGAALASCGREKETIQGDCPAIFAKIRTNIPRHVENASTTVRQEIADIFSQPRNGRIPSLSDAINELGHRFEGHYQGVVDAFYQEIRRDSAALGSRVARSLAQLRAKVPLPDSLEKLRASLLGDGELQNTAYLPDLRDSGLKGQKLFAGGIGGVAGGAIAFLAGLAAFPALMAGIAFAATAWKIVDAARDHPSSWRELERGIVSHFEKCFDELQGTLDQAAAQIEHMSITRVHAVMEPYLSDLEKRLDEIRPLTPEERELHQELTAEIEKSIALLERTFKT